MIRTITKYIDRQRFGETLFTEPVTANLGIVVAIPAIAEPDLLESLQSLKKCTLPEDVGVEVLVGINQSVDASKKINSENRSIGEEARVWAEENSTEKLKFLISEVSVLPKKHAGAGLARKVIMDEAVVRLQNSAIENPIIAAFDADATCSENYLVELWEHFLKNPKSLGCSINFEHPLTVGETEKLNEGIIQYELHLRYYQAAMAYAHHPNAEFTVGSSMAVTRNAYVLQGGMNRRKAGEDFWFMLKLMMAGEITAITNATVFPSSRESDRVPFGTGRAILEMKEKNDSTFYTTPFGSFEKLKVLQQLVPQFYKGNYRVKDALTLRFLESVNWVQAIEEIKLYTTNYSNFEKRFYRWFNSFMVMKYFHFMRNEGMPDVPVVKASKDLFVKFNEFRDLTSLEYLENLRHKKRVQPKDYTL